MRPSSTSSFRSRSVLLAVALFLGQSILPPLHASDLNDAPSTAQDQGADLGDAYCFLDPNDNTRAVLALTAHGYLVPGAAVSAAVFDPKVQFMFEIENTGDAVADKKVKVRFDAPTVPGGPQVAHVKGQGINFTAPTTPGSLAAKASAPVVTTDDATGFRFFAGTVADPFFADLVAVNRYFDSARGGAPNATLLQRGRNTQAGYNILAIALSVPVSYLQGSASTIGLDAVTKRRPQTPNKTGGYLAEGAFVAVDRVGVPLVNALFVPYARRDEYNAAKTADDAAGKFSGDIAASLRSLGTNDVFVSVLSGLVSKGDFLRLNTTLANAGTRGGSNPAAAFPNGRRLGDDVVDTLLNLVFNGAVSGDGVNGSDVPPQDTFPFFGLPHEPLESGATDSTQN